jgi:hypothetical protein
MSRAQHILAIIVGLITGVLLVESYGAMVTAARAGGRAIPELWPLGTEALALVAQFQARTPAAVEQNGGRPAAADADPEAGP